MREAPEGQRVFVARASRRWRTILELFCLVRHESSNPVLIYLPRNALASMTKLN